MQTAAVAAKVGSPFYGRRFALHSGLSGWGEVQNSFFSAVMEIYVEIDPSFFRLLFELCSYSNDTKQGDHLFIDLIDFLQFLSKSLYLNSFLSVCVTWIGHTSTFYCFNSSKCTVIVLLSKVKMMYLHIINIKTLSHLCPNRWNFLVTFYCKFNQNSWLYWLFGIG